MLKKTFLAGKLWSEVNKSQQIVNDLFKKKMDEPTKVQAHRAQGQDPVSSTPKPNRRTDWCAIVVH